MKKSIKLCLLSILLFSLVIGCSDDTIREVRIYEMNSFTETNKDSLKVITDSDDIDIFISAINNATENLGIANMGDPDYKIKLGKDIYFLWIYEDAGKIVNLLNTHTTFSLSKESVKQVNQVILRLYK